MGVGHVVWRDTAPLWQRPAEGGNRQTQQGLELRGVLGRYRGPPRRQGVIVPGLVAHGDLTPAGNTRKRCLSEVWVENPQGQ